MVNRRHNQSLGNNVLRSRRWNNSSSSFVEQSHFVFMRGALAMLIGAGGGGKGVFAYTTTILYPPVG